MDATQNEVEENPYLALRRAKIARNEARMRELGLLKRKRPAVTLENSLPFAPSVSPRTEKSEDVEIPQPRRRSSRLRKSSPSVVSEDIIRVEQHPKRKRRQPSTTRNISSRPRPPAASQSFPSHSARAMSLNVDKLVNHVLGKPMEHTGKAFVMEESAKLAVADHEGGKVSFNKYCGVQEWGNDSLFLWVNLGAPNSDVINDFLNDGQQVTWYGGSRMHDGTAAIRKLVKVGSASSLSPENGIVLWCRQYIPAQKTFSSYVCLGRLSLVSYNPDTHPLAFVWKLVDFERLTNAKDESIRKAFRNLAQTD